MKKFKKESLKAVSLVKRFFLDGFIRDYELKRICKRKGKCKRCGRCCGDCKYLIKKGKNKICKVYKNRPFLCYKNFPLSEFDKKVWDVEEYCGYKF